jgi:glycosyltransferase involved in cell wall biosynthesis
MPKVSIILPTYNRAEVLQRALESVARQSYKEWELIVVDDGSTDATEAVVKGSGIPARYLRAQHGGVSAARNLGIQASQSEYVAFLDSDDAWDPSFLAVCSRFLDEYPGEAFVATELLQDFGQGERILYPYMFVHKWYPELARRIGSDALDLPPGETDPYMRIFSQRIDVTDWLAEACGKRSPEKVFRYHGDLFPHVRWGYLFTVVATVVRRSAIEEAGLFDVSLTSGEDFLFLAQICRRHPGNFIAWPGQIKHEFDQKGLTMKEGHLATTGRRMIQFHINLLRVFDILHDTGESSELDLRKLKGYGLFTVAHHALRLGDYRLARRYLEESVRYFPGFKPAQAALFLTRIIPRVSAKLYGPMDRVLEAAGRLIRGRFNVRGYLHRLAESLRRSEVTLP